MGQRIEQGRRELNTYGADPEEISFYLLGAGTAAPTFGAGCPGAMVGTITRGGAGKYTVNLNVPVYAVIAHIASVDDTASPDFSTATIGNFANEATTTGLSFQLNTITSGSAADMAANRKIRIRLRIQRSNWGKMT